MSVKVGSPVRGDDFFNRERELRRLWQHVTADHVLLLAPRRVGKTSLMLKLLDEAAAHDVTALYITVEGADTELDFVERLHKGAETIEGALPLLKRISDSSLGALVRRVKKVGPVELSDAESARWDTLGEEIVAALHEVAKETKRRVLLLVDEVPVFLLQLLQQDPSGARVRAFLHWVRELRVNPRFDDQVRWLVAGSIGLDNVARRLGLTKTINDFYVFQNLGAFSEAEARALLEARAVEHTFLLDEPVKARLIEQTGWLIPYHLQLLFSELMDHCGDLKIPATVEEVDAACERLIERGTYFDHWVERLREELGTPDDRQAMEVLHAAARDPEGAPYAALQGALSRFVSDIDARDEKLDFLRGVLTSDGYLVEVDGRYRFQSSLLRAYWLRRFNLRRPPSSPEVAQ
jgi:hypothetical protein